MTALEITAERPDQADVAPLLAASDAYVAALYPADSNHMLSLEALLDPAVTFFVARASGRAVGCGALVGHEGYGEIKRMFVAETARGQGAARHLLAAIEAAARAAGFAVVRLETGIRQPEAQRLYLSSGYREIGPFGDYGPDPVSVFMEKRLG